MRRVRSNGRRVIWSALGVLLAGLALAAPAEAASGAHASIVGGTTGTSEEWPWAAFILAADRKGNGFSCSGTVIAPNLVLTAGHCVEDIITGKRTPVGQYAVVTGSNDVRDSTMRQISGVSRTIPFPHFNRFKVHGDAALLVLSTPTTVPAVALATPTDTALYASNTPAWIAGWGLFGPLSKLRRTPVLRRGATFVQPRTLLPQPRPRSTTRSSTPPRSSARSPRPASASGPATETAAARHWPSAKTGHRCRSESPAWARPIATPACRTSSPGWTGSTDGSAGRSPRRRRHLPPSPKADRKLVQENFDGFTLQYLNSKARTSLLALFAVRSRRSCILNAPFLSPALSFLAILRK